MKVYKVKIYYVDHFHDMGSLKRLDENEDTYVLVKKNFWDVREIITDKEIKVCLDKEEKKERASLTYFDKLLNKIYNTKLVKYLEPSFIDNLDFNEYKKYGCVLGVKESDLVHKNLATEEDLQNYLDGWITSKLRVRLDKMKVTETMNEQTKKVNKKVKQLSKISEI